MNLKCLFKKESHEYFCFSPMSCKFYFFAPLFVSCTAALKLYSPSFALTADLLPMLVNMEMMLFWHALVGPATQKAHDPEAKPTIRIVRL